MADHNLARSRDNGPDGFADDDPLAELARIVGYDERLVPTPQAPVPPGLNAPRREPAFNLEDELLREFERYDTPRLDPANDVVMDDARVVHQPFEPSFEEAAPVEPFGRELAADADVEPSHAFAPAEWPSEGEPAPLFDSAPEAVAVQPFEAPALDRQEPSFDRAPEFDLADEVAASLQQSIQPEFVSPQADRAAGASNQDQPYSFDLADELETSIAAQPAPAELPQPKAEQKRRDAYVPGFRMPLANFHPNPAMNEFPRPAPKVEPAAPVLSEPTPAWDFVPPAPIGASEPWPVADALSALRADIAKQEAPAPVFPTTQAATPAEPIKLSPLVGLPHGAGIAAQQPVPPSAAPAAPAALSSEPRSISEAAQPAVTSPAVAPIEPVSVVDEAVAAADFDPFADEEFELALDDLELDLADIVVQENSRQIAEPVRVEPRVEPKAAAVVPQPVAPQPVAPIQVAPQPAVHSPAPVVAAAPMPAAQPYVPELPAASESYETAEADLPFDPALIAEAEERPEALAELEVPSLPAEEPEQEAPYRPDYDIDIDAELATLLVSAEPAAPAAPVQAAPVAPAAAAPTAAAEAKPQEPRSIYADLDEFERALEEDFRRSLATPLPASERHAQLNGNGESGYDGERRGVSRTWVLPIAVVGALAVAGGGAYAWLGGGVSGIGSGEPVIIAADKDPIKVAPENPGGKTVPNQDKAVYDRVAGAAPEAPKQQTLISSNEEPVDVVQKTLLPEGLPLEGENDIEPTEVGETQDPRLLPQQEEQTAASGQQDPVTVMPRKVKTMIVRADGKLVEQEVTPPATEPALAAIQSEKIPAAATKSAEVAALPAEDVNGRMTPDMAPALAAPTQAKAPAVVPVSAPAQPAVDADVASLAAEPAVVQPAAPVGRTPVPTMRPAQQPVKVVAAVTDQGNVRPAQAPAAAAPTQVASLGDGGYVIQIASLPSQADAQKSYQNLSAKFGSVIGGRGVDIKAAEIAGKGTFYRVRIPAGSKADAVALCEKYRSAGGTCLVAK